MVFGDSHKPQYSKVTGPCGLEKKGMEHADRNMGRIKKGMIRRIFLNVVDIGLTMVVFCLGMLFL